MSTQEQTFQACNPIRSPVIAGLKTRCDSRSALPAALPLKVLRESRYHLTLDNMADDAMAADASSDPRPDINQMDGAGVDNQGGPLVTDVEFEVVVKRIDETSPLYSVSSFEKLDLCVLRPRPFTVC